MDYFNAFQIRKELEGKTKESSFISHGGKTIFEKKYIRKNRIIKQIEIISAKNKKQYLESVSLYDLRMLTSLLEKLNFKIIKVFGNYSGEEYNEKSPRLILLVQK